MKRVLLVAIAMVVSFVPAGASGDSDPVVDNEWALTDPPANTPSTGIWFSEPVLQPSSTSYLTSYPECSGTWEECAAKEKRSEHICKSVWTETCATETQIAYSAFLPKCKDDLDTNCIESVWVRIGDKKVYGELESYMPKSSPLHFAGDKTINLPEGKSTSLWRFAPGAVDDQEHLLSLSARLHGRSAEKPFVKFPTPSRLEVVIDPVRIHKGNYQIPYASTTGNGWSITGGYTRERDGTFGSTYIGFCSAIDTGVCARRQNSIKGARYGTTLRLMDPPAAWLSGRLKDPSFDITSKNDSFLWSIEADPLIVPVASAWIPNTDVENVFPGRKLSRKEETSWTGPLSRGDKALRDFLSWEKFIGDKAGALHSRWSLESIQDSSLLFNGKSLKECLSNDRVAGIVTSNAMVFQDSPPKWNAFENAFDYVVAGPHLLPDGQENLGLYRVKLNQQFARCVYGLSDVPIVATVSVIGEGVVRKVATSSIQSSEDWINLAISGFTYSSPTIRFKLQTATPGLIPTPTPTPTPAASTSPTTAPSPASSPTVISSKKVTITCVKGKQTKKVSGANPKCPQGFKKK